MQEMYRYKVGSLFAGIGGIDLAFLQVGCKIEWANEIDVNACKSYERNFDHKIICKDIKNLTSEELVPIDILTGGFPCQAFSIAGHRKGFADERGTVVFELLRIVKSILPRVVFLENVKNLKSHNKGETFKSILQNNGECYIIPIADIENWSKSRSFKNLHSYRENWKILIDLAKNKD